MIIFSFLLNHIGKILFVNYRKFQIDWVFGCREIGKHFFRIASIFHSCLNGFSFSDVWKLLKEEKFEEFEKIVRSKLNIINSLRDDKYGRTLLMRAVVEKNLKSFDRVL